MSGREELVRVRGSASFFGATLKVSAGPVVSLDGPRGPATLRMSGQLLKN